MSNDREEAKKLFDEGLSPAEISERLNIPANKIRSWKSRYKWEDVAQHKTQQKAQRKSKKEAAPNKKAPINEVSTRVEPQLTEGQKLFCEIFVRNRNATIAYMKSHPGCTYNAASVKGYEAIRNGKISAYIDRLRDLKAEAIKLAPDDIIEKYMRTAFADMTDFATWGFDGNDNQLASMPSEMVDGTLVCEVSKSKGGFKIKLEDRQKALDWLTVWFGMNPMDKHKIEFDNRQIALDERKQDRTPDTEAGNQQTLAIADLINNSVSERKLEDFMNKEAIIDDTVCASDSEAD